MTRRHQVRTLAALGLGAPLLVGLGIGGFSQAVATTAAPTAQDVPAAVSAPAERTGSQEDTAEEDGAAGEANAAPSDVFTTGSQEFASADRSTITAEDVASQLYGYAADPSLSDEATCTDGLALDQPGAVTRCTVIGWSGEQETYYGYMAPAGVAEADYWLYFSKDAPLPEEAAATLNDGLNGTGAYPVWGEEQEQPTTLTEDVAVERANFVLDGFGREDLTVTSVEGEVDLTSTTPVRGTAVEDGSGRTVGVTLLPIPTDGEAPAMMISIDGP